MIPRLKNAHGQSSMYHLMPLRWGRPRHQEAFAQNDFWVTLYKGSEMWAKDVTTYIANSENVANADVVVWYMGSVHHLPRAEDGESTGGVFRGRGPPDVDRMAAEAAQRVRPHTAVRTARALSGRVSTPFSPAIPASPSKF